MPDHKTLDVGHVAARLLSVTLPMGLTLDEVLIQGERVHLEHKPFSISLKEPGTLEVRISDAALADFLNKKKPGGLTGFQVTFKEDLIHVEAKAPIVPLGVSAVCRLRIEDSSKLFVELVRMESIGGSGAANIVQRNLDSINPVLDAAELPLDATIETVEADKEWLVLKGTIAPKP